MTLSVNKLNSYLKTDVVDFDPNSTAEVAAVRAGGAYYDMRDFAGVRVAFVRTIGTADITLKIVASDAAATGGNEATIATKVFTDGQPNTVGDVVFLETLSEVIGAKAAQDGFNYRYIYAKISVATNTDEAVVIYDRFEPRFAFNALTSDYIS